jgi:hypothetical protein
MRSPARFGVIDGDTTMHESVTVNPKIPSSDN